MAIPHIIAGQAEATVERFNAVIDVANNVEQKAIEIETIAQSVRDDADAGKFDGEQGETGLPVLTMQAGGVTRQDDPQIYAQYSFLSSSAMSRTPVVNDLFYMLWRNEISARTFNVGCRVRSVVPFTWSVEFISDNTGSPGAGAENAILHTAQSLTPAQKTQARTNIDAPSVSNLNSKVSISRTSGDLSAYFYNNGSSLAISLERGLAIIGRFMIDDFDGITLDTIHHIKFNGQKFSDFIVEYGNLPDIGSGTTLLTECWYRKWKSGRVEQGFRTATAGSSSNVTITFPTPMPDANYTATINFESASSLYATNVEYNHLQIVARTTTSCQFRVPTTGIGSKSIILSSWR